MVGGWVREERELCAVMGVCAGDRVIDRVGEETRAWDAICVCGVVGLVASGFEKDVWCQTDRRKGGGFHEDKMTTPRDVVDLLVVHSGRDLIRLKVRSVSSQVHTYTRHELLRSIHQLL